MLLLNQKLAEEFMKKNPGISVYVEGGGSRTGINALVNNSVEICAASRPLEPEEIKIFGEKFRTVGLSYLIARDALSIYINPSNPVKNLSIEQVSQIYTCQINNWKELGGPDEPIQPIRRSSASGTNLYFIKHILKSENICSTIPIANTTQEIINFVSKNSNSIGYGGIGYADSSMQCRINFVEPSRSNVINNSYPISRYLRYYTSRKPKGDVKNYIDWVTSEDGQNFVESMGYIPLWD